MTPAQRSRFDRIRVEARVLMAELRISRDAAVGEEKGRYRYPARMLEYADRDMESAQAFDDKRREAAA